MSAAVIQHPEQPDVPAYRVQVLQPAPSPLPPSSKINTPAASIAPTPRNEPTPVERILTPSEVTSIFLKSLLKSAEDFLGRKAAKNLSIDDLFFFAKFASPRLEFVCGHEAILHLTIESGHLNLACKDAVKPNARADKYVSLP